MTTRAAKWSLAVLLSVGCGQASPPKAPLATEPLVTVRTTMPPPVFTSWAAPEDLVTDPKTLARIAAFVPLSRSKHVPIPGFRESEWTVESHGVGVGERPSSEYAAFTALDETMTPREAMALLRVDNPPLRVYVARHVALKMPDKAADTLYPLLADHTVVGTLEGCRGGEDTVASLVLASILAYDFANDREKHGYMNVVANDARIDPVTRGLGLAQLAELDGPLARPIALAAATSDDGAWRRNGIRALGIIGNTDDIDLVMRFATSAEAWDRETGLEALGGMRSPLVKEKLKELAMRPDADWGPVRSYAAQEGVTEDDLAYFLTSPSRTSVGEAGRQLAKRGTLHALQLLESNLMTEQAALDEIDLQMFLMKVGLPGAPVMRHLLGAAYRSTRDAAIASLGDLGDTTAVPALRKIAAKGESTYLVAKALGQLHATEATPDLVKMLRDDNSNARIDAANALVQLNAKTALPEVEAAAKTGDPRERLEIGKAADALRNR